MYRRIIAAGTVLSALLWSGVALAQEVTTTTTEAASSAITFPIAELGNCESKSACKTYCDNPSNRDACFAFAEARGLMKKEEVEKARILVSLKTGPGGCTTREACRTYCEDSANEEACATFAQQHGLLRAAHVSFVQNIKQNGGPGGCASLKECRAYCSDATRAQECRAFADEHGLLSVPAVEKAREALQDVNERRAKIEAALKERGGPGGCKTQEECRTYCADPAHQEICMAFGKERGLISKEESDKAAALMTAVKDGGPGGCADAASCKEFCSAEANREACQNFAKERGLIRPADARTDVRPGAKRPEDAKTDVRPDVKRPADTMSEELRAKCAKNPEACARIMNQGASNAGERAPDAKPKPRPAPVPERKPFEPRPETLNTDSQTQTRDMGGEVKPVAPSADTLAPQGANVLGSVLDFLGAR